MPISVALSSHFEAFIKEQVESGRYNNVSEVIRAGLRMLEEKEQAMQLDELKMAIALGMKSGEGKPADEIFNRLQKKYCQQIK